MSLPPKYAPLAAYLREQPPAVDRLTLTVTDVEAIIGAPLPASARDRAWWANTPQTAQARAWRSAGWRVASVQWRPRGPLERTATFVRVASETRASRSGRGRPPRPAEARERRSGDRSIGDR